jgi:hypothetical protein
VAYGAFVRAPCRVTCGHVSRANWSTGSMMICVVAFLPSINSPCVIASRCRRKQGSSQPTPVRPAGGKNAIRDLHSLTCRLPSTHWKAQQASCSFCSDLNHSKDGDGISEWFL